MLSRKQKALFYTVAGPVMAVSQSIYKYLFAPKSNNNETIKVQLGPGQKGYLKGWINVDANAFSGKPDVWADFSNSIPFKDESVDFLFSHHVIEHLPNLKAHLNEVYRVLKKGGKIRIGGPNGDTAMKKYVANDAEWFINFPDVRSSIGGKLENFIYCRGEHLTLLTFSFLEELLTEVGFKKITQRIAKNTTGYREFVDDDVFRIEWEIDPEHPLSLMIEAEK